MKARRKNRKPDDPILVYRQLNQHMTQLFELVSNLSKVQGCYLDRIFNQIWPVLNNTIPKVQFAALIGLDNNTSNIKIYETNKTSFLNSRLNDNPYDIVKVLNQISEKGQMFWNFRSEAPNFFNESGDQRACTVTFLTKLPNDEKLFLIMATPASTKKHLLNEYFIDYEINTIQLMSKIIGWYISHTFHFEVNQYLMAERFEKIS
jgi:hypothetical protein